MEWMKSHLHVVIAGSISFLAIVALMLGVMLPNPAQTMRDDRPLIDRLVGAHVPSPSKVNVLTARVTGDRVVVLEWKNKQGEVVKLAYLRSTKEIFPKVMRQGAPYAFRDEFRAALLKLLADISAGSLAWDSEIKEAELWIAQMQANKQLGGAPAPPAQGGPRVNLATVPAAEAGPAPRAGGIAQLPPDATPDQRVNGDPIARASVVKARRCRCYVTFAELDQRPVILGGDASQPRLEDMWYAQLALWLQQAILNALADLNQDRASTLPANKQWVAYLPFKRLVAFNVLGYVPKTQEGSTGSFAGGGESKAFLTGHTCTPNVDVVQFTLEIVIEAKSLLQVIDKINRAGLYTVLELSYEVEKPSRELHGYIYGPEPVIKVSMLLEASFSRSLYDTRMPEQVKKDIGDGKLVGGGGVPNSSNRPPQSRSSFGAPEGYEPVRRPM